jgi:GNAT superfamily N-acetyltransferase
MLATGVLYSADLDESNGKATKFCQKWVDKLKDSWLCRDYQSGDEHQIIALYKQVTDREMGLDFWKWRYITNPFGKGIIKLMFEQDKLIGHIGGHPVDIQSKDVPATRVFHQMNTMTHPAYQRQGIWGHLTVELHKKCKQLGIKLVYGFPNKLTYPADMKRGWKGFGKMSILSKDLQAESSHLPFSEGIHETCQIERFGTDIDLLWHKVKGEYNVIVPRTREFLNWRYVQCPAVNYAKYVCRDSNGEALGYIILKIYSTGTETIGHIVDIFSANDNEIVKGLIRGAYNYFIGKGVSDISCWMQDNYFYADMLKEEGLVRKEIAGFYPYFGVKALGPADPLVSSLEHIENWYLTMGDSDVF